MKKGFFTRMKNWCKEYYKDLSESLKNDKTVSQLSWGVIFVGAFTTFAFLLANPAGGAFMASAFLTGMAFIDMYSNVMQGNSTSYLMRGVMYAGMTVLAPVVAVAEYGIEKHREHKAYREAQNKGVILDKQFEANTPEKVDTKEISNEPATTEFVSQKHTYEEATAPVKAAPVVESADDEQTM